MKHCKVLILEGFSGELSYKLPESLQAEIGYKVIVPLGGRLTQGLVTLIDENPPDDIDLKEVLSISTAYALFDEEVLEASLLMDAESFNMGGFHLSNFLFNPPSPKIYKIVKVTGAAGNLTPSEQNLLETIKANDSNIKLSTLNRKIGKRKVTYSLRGLLSKGVIEIDEVIQAPKYSFKKTWKFTSKPENEIEKKISDVSHLASTKTELAQLSGASTYKINKLIESGKIVTEVKKPIPAKKGLEKPRYSESIFSQISYKIRINDYIKIAKELIEEDRSMIIVCSNIHACRNLFNQMKEEVPNLHLAIGGLGIRESSLLSESLKVQAPMIIIGMQTAMLFPMPNLSHIIVDEPLSPHMDVSLPHTLHLSKAANIRAKVSDCPISFYSSPSLLDQKNTSLGVSTKSLDIEVVNMVYEPTAFEQPLLSGAASSAIKKELENNGQIIIYLNRKGFSCFVFCSECNEVLRCPKCKVPLIYSRSSYTVKCRYCGHQSNAPDICPSCGGVSIRYKAGGVERLFLELTKQFPEVKIKRADGDTKESAKNINDFNSGSLKIILGTSMILDRVDFSKAGLVIIGSLDGLLSMPVFSASHKAYSTLSIIRDKSARRMMLQTYLPLHPLIKALSTKKVNEFLKTEISEREDADYPPFTELFFWHVVSKSESKSKKDAELVSSKLLEILGEECVSYPNKGYFHRLKGEYRWDIMVKTKKLENHLSDLRELFESLRNLGVRVEIIIPNL